MVYHCATREFIYMYEVVVVVVVVSRCSTCILTLFAILMAALAHLDKLDANIRAEKAKGARTTQIFM